MNQLAADLAAATHHTPTLSSILRGLCWIWQDKIEIIAREIYGAAAVEYLPKAEEQLASLEKLGFGSLPICMAKTQYSFSADPAAKGVPTGFTLPIRDAQVSSCQRCCGNVLHRATAHRCLLREQAIMLAVARLHLVAS